MMFHRRATVAGALAAAASAAILLMPVSGASAQTTIRAVMHSDLKILDPIWTTAYIVRNHGYMIYDTLLSLDEKQQIKPQMVDKWEESADKLTYTFTLRDGLKWHDGAPVTAADCVPSLKRWGARDIMGQKLMASVKDMKVVNDKTFTIELKEPYGLVLESLAKPSSNVPFIMPKRVAETSPTEQISDTTGSGPFIFKRDEWKPGEKTVYIKNKDYKPRSEPASWASGGKVVNVDRVEWLAIADSQTAVNALLAGEIDVIEVSSIDLMPVMKADKNIALEDLNKLGNQYVIKFNWLTKPFDNQKIRRAAITALNQEDFLKAVIGDPEYYQVCMAMFVCGTALATEKGTEGILRSNFEASKKLLQEAGYDGTPVLLLHSTDLQVLANLAPVAKSLLERGGFKVNMVSMDWQSVVARRAKKDPIDQGGWSAFLTSWVGADIVNPVSAAYFAANCDKAPVGWPCDTKMEELRDRFAKERDPAKQKALAEEIQTHALEIGTHAHLGQWTAPVAYRKDKLNGLLPSPFPLMFWSVKKTGA